ncbi:MAG: nuclear transport factor 2 family protein [Minisyncoccota bacterium]
MITQELLETYYKGLAQKAGWDAILSDDFKFIGGDMTKRTPVIGKDAYGEVIKRFSQLFTTMRVKEMFVEGDRACVLASYDYTFPSGTKINGDVAEFWTVKDEKLDSLTIFFDTAGFAALTKK